MSFWHALFAGAAVSNSLMIVVAMWLFGPPSDQESVSTYTADLRSAGIGLGLVAFNWLFAALVVAAVTFGRI